ncbi:MAG: GldG family protein [Ruminococcus sp.]|nr:GldG family protein [Ruminococcus sp.]
MENNEKASSGSVLDDIVKKQREGKLSKDSGKPGDDEDDEDDKPSKEKKHTNVKQLKHGMMATILTLIFVAAVVLVNVIATVIFERYPLTIDLTQEKKYSISEQSEDYVKSIDVDVTVTVFATEENFLALSDYTRQAIEVLKKYTQYNDRISYRFVDIDSNPDIVSEYGIDTITAYDIMVETNPSKDVKRTRKVTMIDLLSFNNDFLTNLSNYGMSIDTLVQQMGSSITFLQYYGGYVEASRADEAFVSALMAVTDPNPMTAVFLTGRKESDSLTYLHTLLEANGYQIKDIDITKENIPDEATVVVVAAPTVDYLPEEVQKLADYLDNDGKMGKQMLYAASVKQPETPNLDEFLEEWGIKIGSGIVCEQNTDKYYSLPYYTIADGVSTNFTQDVLDTKEIINARSRPITLLFDEKGYNGTEAYVTSSDSAVVLDMKTAETVAKGKQIYTALASKAVFSTEDGTGTYSNIIVCGSVESISDNYLSYTQFGNREYFLSLINGITHKTSTGITIEPKVITGNVYDLTDSQSSVLQWTFTLIIPVIVLIIGGIIWVRRKNR